MSQTRNFHFGSPVTGHRLTPISPFTDLSFAVVPRLQRREISTIPSATFRCRPFQGQLVLSDTIPEITASVVREGFMRLVAFISGLSISSTANGIGKMAIILRETRSARRGLDLDQRLFDFSIFSLSRRLCCSSSKARLYPEQRKKAVIGHYLCPQGADRDWLGVPLVCG